MATVLPIRSPSNQVQLHMSSSRSRHYVCLDTLGSGTYGTCYRVVPSHGGEQCVMKVISLNGLPEKDVKGAFREATLLSQVRHPNVVEYLDAWVENNHLYIVMAHCRGGDLSQRLKAATMEESAIWRCARDIACGLEHLHCRRIMHRCVCGLAVRRPDLQSQLGPLVQACCAQQCHYASALEHLLCTHELD